jgi:Fur family peroxide stress response transcriptional regulator
MPRGDDHHQRSEAIEGRADLLKALCRQRGLAFTHQRLSVLRAVLESDGHPTAEGVYRRLHRQYPSMSRATVYKALTVLSGLGIIAKMAPPGVARTAALFDPRLERHHHALCRTCGHIDDVDDTRLPRPSLPRSSGFTVEDYTINFYGSCRQCAQGRILSKGGQP